MPNPAELARVTSPYDPLSMPPSPWGSDISCARARERERERDGQHCTVLCELIKLPPAPQRPGARVCASTGRQQKAPRRSPATVSVYTVRGHCARLKTSPRNGTHLEQWTRQQPAIRSFLQLGTAREHEKLVSVARVCPVCPGGSETSSPLSHQASHSYVQRRGRLHRMHLTHVLDDAALAQRARRRRLQRPGF